MRRLIASILTTLALAISLTTARAQPVPCGYVDGQPWFVQDGDGNPRPCPPEPGTPPPTPEPPPPPPDYPARSILVPINP